MVINHLLTGMILQVISWEKDDQSYMLPHPHLTAFFGKGRQANTPGFVQGGLAASYK